MIVILVIAILGALCDAMTYENYTLFRGIPVEESHLKFLENLSSYDASYWRRPGSLQMPVDFLIGPEQKQLFLDEAKQNGIYLTTLVENIQSAFDNQTVKSYTRKQMDTFDWQDFYRTNDMYAWMRDLAKAYPEEMKIFSIGKTHENRDILAAKVVLNGSLLRSKVIIEGGIHAREWISPAFVTYLLNQIIYSSKSPNKILRTIGITYEWYFVPVLNPDGYEYTITKDRNWRKNRHASGVDLNRNFGYGFGTAGVSRNPQADVYCGPRAFSEKESIAMAKFISSNSENLEYYLSFHSYGQFIVIPYAHSKKHVENFKEVQEMGFAAAEKIRAHHNKKYKVGTAYDTVGYLVSGASTCWAKNNFSVPYTVTFELRDQGTYGFALPVREIIPTCEETLSGVLSFLTPRSKKFVQMKHGHHALLDNGANVADKIVVFIQLLFIILWLD